MNQEIQTILQEIIQLLEKEKELLVLSIKNHDVSKQLEEIIEQKKSALSKLSEQNEEDILQNKKELETIKLLNERNIELAKNNLNFIDSMFEAIFCDEAKQYTPNGELTSQKEGLVNKKA
ncbi:MULTISPECIES: hypothetical protein [unclassified Nitratiruptor]|uniref:hypothetical protein n=1 Tax=unclassified Nitratiruptor TaxID=2624044 RepID=UPI0019156F14|nr:MULTISPECIES: hypothetical protein [unclassified Nitratiruptor]BCD59946.1 hypothetical protein NitYY0810_C0705 [Nitratiruptor sp. YY08-10]BCD63869.1 hypothetical protein NitYY0814_C0704 [Nitratiruptor sp. YY08-14]